MSRIGKLPVGIPNGVKVAVSGRTVAVEGPKGKLSLETSHHVQVDVHSAQIEVKRRGESKDARARHGLYRKLIFNMVTGVSSGFSRALVINGVGYRAQASGKTLNLTLGFSHPVEYTLPEGVVAETPKNTTIVLKGADKQRLGQVAAEIRAFRPPEPYKGKGIRYGDEQIRRKEAKKK